VLHLDRTLHGFDYARELGQQAIPARACRLAAMLLHHGTHQVEIRGEGAESGRLICPNEATVAFNIRMKDGGELVFHMSPSLQAIILLVVCVCQTVQGN
jgi:hypothetical protein